MGPLELADLIGLDTCLAIAEVLHRELGDDKYRPCAAASPVRRRGLARHARVGRGFYKYDRRARESHELRERSRYAVATGALATVTINREAAAQRAHRADVMQRAARRGVRELDADARRSRRSSLTGAGDKAFVAGADIAEMRELAPTEAQRVRRAGGARRRRDRDDRPKPWIAAVNGFALGGGCELALRVRLHLRRRHAPSSASPRSSSA